MPLFMDHFRRNHSLADPLLITNQFSWLLVLMIASIRAMNGDRWSTRTHLTAHDAEATVAFSPAPLSQGIGKPQCAQQTLLTSHGPNQSFRAIRTAH